MEREGSLSERMERLAILRWVFGEVLEGDAFGKGGSNCTSFFFFLSPLQGLHIQLKVLSTLLVRHNLCNAPNQKRLFPIHDNYSIPTYPPIFQDPFLFPLQLPQATICVPWPAQLAQLVSSWLLCVDAVGALHTGRQAFSTSDHLLAPFYQRSNGVEDYRSSFAALLPCMSSNEGCYCPG